ncbi:zinc-binding alcohol dehydrogenase family protein [Lacticaseibacillus rhamnosus]|uniref:zinc-binding alcohol dehydrogenase family protein n=1 Tax=Lacticaseibacillus rhamnosus TaxID=47715 RepID=UPI00065DAA82|nr:zinc-binding alcohol dehydrogenase family protein [Lacticaseibacillus rhamnosus]KMO57781.1 NADPH:quinone reductase [Lacticaseibacillus rhamnosus]MBE8124622.1 zinc-binding alcohol dehydrogenase family protein [Lacticaseibacillus rhamnosus]MDI3332810.1 zinc-binding alcohol dehydrogenase family protein [Lacticaseibacillus rhamnosus]
MSQNIAIGFTKGLAITAENSFQSFALPVPTPQPNEVVVQVDGVSVNPIDTKRRQAATRQATPQVLGYDAVGTITQVGAQVAGYHVGDRVIYAGTTRKPGSNQQYQAVDARLIARAPQQAPTADLAALPLVGLTAWELLFEKMGFIPEYNANKGQQLLIINGAGGVGSMLSQLAHWSGLTVLATSSPKNHSWLRDHHVDVPLDYHEDLIAQIHQAGIQTVDGIALLYHPEPYLAAASQLIRAFGHIGCIVGPQAGLDLAVVKDKAASFDYEYMFAKTDFAYHIASQGAILSKLLTLYQDGQIKASVTKEFTGINVANLKAATQLVEEGHMVGKVVLTGPFSL